MSLCKVGGYKSYFQESHCIRADHNYAATIRSFELWTNKAMSLKYFKYISSAFYPEGPQMTGCKNKASIDIDVTVKNLPTIQKAVANAIIESGIVNYSDGCKYLYMDNHYTAPQLFAMMASNWNVQGMGICKANRKIFSLDELQLDK
eukprot:15365854-Ditylum_brightwellii.AAC.1